MLLTIAPSCKRVKPQAPANIPKEDSTSILASQVNLRLAETANLECAHYVQQADTSYVLSDYGFWFCMNHRSGGTLLKSQDKIELLMETYLLDGTLIESTQQQIEVGRRETLFAVDLLLPDLAPGDVVTIVSPYYAAYGRDGNELVAPLTNCIIHLSNISLQQ